MEKEDGRRAVAARRQAVSTPLPSFPFLLRLFLPPPLVVIAVVVHSGYAAVRGGGGGLATGGAPAEEEGRARDAVASSSMFAQQSICKGGRGTDVAMGRQAVRTPPPPFCFLLLVHLTPLLVVVIVLHSGTGTLRRSRSQAHAARWRRRPRGARCAAVHHPEGPLAAEEVSRVLLFHFFFSFF